MQELLISILNEYGYLGITLLICIENVFPPIPSEVVLAFGGFMTTYTNMNVWLVILFATVGSATGAVILYYVGFALEKERLKKIAAGKTGKILRLKPGDIDKADEWFARLEKKAVFFCRCVPIVRSLISIPAGMSKMDFGTFFLLTVLGSAIWNTILVWIGAAAGAAWESSVAYFEWYSKAALFVILFACIIGIVYYCIKKRNSK